MKIVFDTNIVLDILLEREPFVSFSINLFNAVEKQIIQGYLCANLKKPKSATAYIYLVNVP
ncbi:PIN domain-containing protein, partial [Dolichospermum sp. ST_con]|nr:PIN domain-containing protein [Dolichospermum sp. ST_con]